MDSSFKNVSALWLEDNKLFWKESTYTKYLFISKNMDKIICDCSLEKINSKIVQQTVNQILICNAMSITTIKTYISVINSVLSFAYDNDYNCVEHIKITFPKNVSFVLVIMPLTSSFSTIKSSIRVLKWTSPPHEIIFSRMFLITVGNLSVPI